jgi:WD40 repeat protein
MDDIFISYSRKDKAFATRLHEALKARQRQAWVDLEDIPPTAEWREKIRAGIEGARAFVFVLSPDSMASPECLKEVDHAAASHKRLLPVVCRDVDTQVVPEALGKLNWIFLREQDDFNKGIDTLLTAVDTDLEWVDVHTSFLEKATEWDRKGRDQSLLLRGSELRAAEGWQVKSAEREPKPTELMASFIVSSRQGETRRQRYLLGGVSGALVVALVLAALAFYQYRVADKRGRIALSRQLAGQGASLPDQDARRDLRDLKLLLSAYAFESFETSEAKSALAKNLLFNPRLIGFIEAGELPEGGEGFAFSPDGKYYAYPINERSTIIMDLKTRQAKHAALHGIKPLFSPDSKLLATQADQEIIIWDVDSGKRLNDKKISGDAMAWRSQPTTVLGVARQNNIDFINADGKVEGHLPLPPNLGKIETMTFRPDGKKLAALDANQQVFLWDALDKTSSVIHLPKANTLVFTPEGDLLGLKLGETLTLSGQGELEIPLIKLSTSAPELSAIKISVKRFIRGVSPDGRYLALEDGSAKGGNALFVWDMQNRRFLEPVLETPSFYDANRLVYWAAFSSDGKLLAYHPRLNDNIYLWDLTGNKGFYREIKGITSNLADLKLALDQDGKVLVSLDSLNNLVFWDVATGKALDIKKNIPGNLEVKDLIFTQDGRLIAVVVTKETAEKTSYRLWDVQAAKFSSPEIEIAGSYESLSKDGQVLMAQSDGDVSLWNVPTQKMVDVIKTKRHITGVSFSPEKNLIAWASKRGSVIELWDVAQKKLLEPLPSEGSSLMLFSPDGKTLVEPGDKQLTFWDLATRQPWTIPLEDEFQTLTFSGNGKLLAVAGTKGKDPESKIGVIKLYNLDTSSWPGIACRIANRNLTRREWRAYMGDLPYQPVCPNLPVPEK